MIALPSSVLDQFLRTVRSRSDEHGNALELLLREKHYAVAIGLIRQEIDTFMRLVYLDAIEERKAAALIGEFVQGSRWPVRDAEMVAVAQKSYFWVEIAYTLGCKLIHLSDFHDYENVDPFVTIPRKSKETIIDFMRAYHGYADADIDLPRFVRLMPAVMKKIRGKVVDYSSRLALR